VKITLNNREEFFDNEIITVSQFLEIKKYSFRMRIVKINGEFIPKEKYDTAEIRDGDDVKMLYLMSGG
jgi:sulfur carrier protein